MRGLILLLPLCCSLHSATAWSAPRIRATRTSAPPLIDGRLDEPAWKGAALLPAFVQRTPREGAAPQQKTEVRVLYDDGAVYFGLRMWDKHPHHIRRGLGRRDAPPDSDWVTVFIDTVESRQRGYFFRVNASGVLTDGLLSQENIMDTSWDGVWSGRAQVDEEGWTAELEIPLTSLAFQDKDRQSWGLYVQRFLQRAKELSGWPAMPKSSNTFVSRFATLDGLDGLRRRSSIRLLPFAALEIQMARPSDSTHPDDTARPNGGLDLRYSFSGGTTVSVSINPDFGQVESDSAVVNLTPNEVYFDEKRPFFVAGSSLFTTPIKLLHTRRIGARPGEPDASDEATITEVDPEARIAGATKLIGDWGPVSYGLLSAFVLPSHAMELRHDGREHQVEADPGGHYGAIRFLARPARTFNVGLLLTGLTHYSADHQDAYAGGVDWDLRSSSGWQTRGQLTAAGAEKAGYGLWLQGGQQGAPRWRYWIEAESFDPNYDINDVGYRWRNDMVQFRGFFQNRLPAPWLIFREMDLTLWGQYGFNHTSPELSFERRVEAAAYAMFTNKWHIWTGVGHRFFTLDDRETRGGPAYPRPAQTYCWLGGQTDSSQRVSLELTMIYAREATSDEFHVDNNLRVALWDRLSASLFLRYRYQHDSTRWIQTLDRPGRPRYIFGDLDRNELDLRLQGMLGITHAFTLQVFGQILYSTGMYEDSYRELYPLDDGTAVLGSTSYDADADYASLTLLFNAILRWDLGSGAAAYLVYKLAGSLSEDGRPISFDLGQALDGLGDDKQSHMLLLKASYGWNI